MPLMIGTYDSKKDVSDLKLDPLFWRRVLWKNYFFTGYRTHFIRSSSAGVWRVMAAITRSKRFRAGISFYAWLLRN